MVLSPCTYSAMIRATMCGKFSHIMSDNATFCSIGRCTSDGCPSRPDPEQAKLDRPLVVPTKLDQASLVKQSLYTARHPSFLRGIQVEPMPHRHIKLKIALCCHTLPVICVPCCILLTLRHPELCQDIIESYCILPGGSDPKGRIQIERSC